MNKNGGRFKLLNLTQILRDLMAATKLLAVFDIYENESQALDSFENHSPLPAESDFGRILEGKE